MFTLVLSPLQPLLVLEAVEDGVGVAVGVCVPVELLEKDTLAELDGDAPIVSDPVGDTEMVVLSLRVVEKFKVPATVDVSDEEKDINTFPMVWLLVKEGEIAGEGDEEEVKEGDREGVGVSEEEKEEVDEIEKELAGSPEVEEGVPTGMTVGVKERLTFPPP